MTILGRIAVCSFLLTLAGCQAQKHASFIFHADGTAEADYVFAMNEEIALSFGSADPCLIALEDEDDRRVEVTSQGEQEGPLPLVCRYRLGPIDSTEMLQRMAGGVFPRGEIQTKWFSTLLTRNALSSKEVLELAGWCGDFPCPGVKMDLQEAMFMKELARPEGKTPGRPDWTGFDTLLNRVFLRFIRIQGDGVKTLKPFPWSDRHSAYYYGGGSRDLLGMDIFLEVAR